MASLRSETIHFSGRVQGVGFRYATLQVAKEFEVAGWVENLADGRVRVEVDGRPEEVDGFVAAIEERLHGYIRQTERTPAVRSSRPQGFVIR